MGIAIFWRKDLHTEIRVLNTGSRRVCAARCVSNTYKLLFFNVHMPFEDSDVNNEEFFFSCQLWRVYIIRGGSRGGWLGWDKPPSCWIRVWFLKTLELVVSE